MSDLNRTTLLCLITLQLEGIDCSESQSLVLVDSWDYLSISLFFPMWSRSIFFRNLFSYKMESYKSSIFFLKLIWLSYCFFARNKFHSIKIKKVNTTLYWNKMCWNTPHPHIKFTTYTRYATPKHIDRTKAKRVCQTKSFIVTPKSISYKHGFWTKRNENP